MSPGLCFPFFHTCSPSPVTLKAPYSAVIPCSDTVTSSGLLLPRWSLSPETDSLETARGQAWTHFPSLGPSPSGLRRLATVQIPAHFEWKAVSKLLLQTHRGSPL